MTSTAEKIGMSLEAFMRRYSDEGPFEIIEGEIVPLSPQVMGSAWIAGKLFLLFALHLEEKTPDYVFIEAPFTLKPFGDPDWVSGSRVPDMMFVRPERMNPYTEAYPNWREQPLALVPALVVEVVSPTDRFNDVIRKVERHFTDGVQTVWVIDPMSQTVTIYTLGSNQQTTLRSDDVLTGGDLISGFEISVSRLFE